MHLADLLYTLSGFCVGVLVGVTGVGGGSVMTPVLILLFGVQPNAPSAPTCSMRRSPKAAAPWCMG